MLVSEDKAIAIDRQNSPHQFSADFGQLQDKRLQQYLSRTGKQLAVHTHRPQMPYDFKGVNATYVNAYAFPGGSIGITRGIMLKLRNEAELSALIGHELGHVNARHTAAIMSKRAVATAVVGGVAAYVGLRNESMGAGLLAAQLGMLTSGVLLAKYSREFAEADRYVERAKAVYPQEAQAHHLSGYTKIQRKNFAAAYNDFDTSEKELPGNPYTIFYKGYSLEKMERTEDAAQQYHRFMQQVREESEAQYAYRRLREWGYVR